MADHSKIRWTDHTWPVVLGCARVSPGCEHCYAERSLATRLRHVYPGIAEMRNGKPRWTRNVLLNEAVLPQAARWQRRVERTGERIRVFVAFSSDLFYERVPDEYIDRVFEAMEAAPGVTFQVLTKRPDRLEEYMVDNFGSETFRPLMPQSRHDDLPRNVWLGTSVEDQLRANRRVPALLRTPAAVRFLSCEPLLEGITIRHYLDGMIHESELPKEPTPVTEWVAQMRARPPQIAWVIAGGESGPGHRPMDIRWARSLRDQCQAAGVAFYFKQRSAARSEQLPYLDGFKWEQYPDVPLAEQPPQWYGSCEGETSDLEDAGLVPVGEPVAL